MTRPHVGLRLLWGNRFLDWSLLWAPWFKKGACGLRFNASGIRLGVGVRSQMAIETIKMGKGCFP